MISDRHLDADTQNYHACVWMTEALKSECIEQVRKMLRALTLGRTLKYSPSHTEPGGKWVLSIDQGFVDGSSREECECKMLGLILGDGIGFPLFRNVGYRDPKTRKTA